MRPARGAVAPTRHEKSVVLPAPLGPMTPKISPRTTSNSMPASATNPSYRFVTPRTSKIGSARMRHGPPHPAGGEAARAIEKTDQAFGLEQRHRDQQSAVQ